jgi:hypothetical protein
VGKKDKGSIKACLPLPKVVVAFGVAVVIVAVVNVTWATTEQERT